MRRACAISAGLLLAWLAGISPAGARAQRSGGTPPAAVRAGGEALPAADRKLLANALDELRRGQVEQATAALGGLAARYPHDFAVNAALGIARLQQGRAQEALPYLEAAAKLRPQSDQAQANLGAAYLQLGRSEDALRHLRAAVRLNPANAPAQANLGLLLAGQGKPAEAARAFGAAAAKEPHNADVFYNWALALDKSGAAAKAAEALAHMPGVEHSPEAQSLYGDIEEKLGHYEAAANHYGQAARLEPSEANIYALGLEMLGHWSFDPAIRILSAGAERYPESERMGRALGLAHYGNGDYAQAAGLFAGLLAAHPESVDLATLLGKACSAQSEDANPKCDALAAFAREHPGDAAVAVYAAVSILRRPLGQQDLGTAKRLLDQAVRADPKLPQAYFELGVLAQQQSAWKGSLAPLEKAVALKPDYTEAHYKLAQAYSHAGRHEDARREAALYRACKQKDTARFEERTKDISTFVTGAR